MALRNDGEEAALSTTTRALALVVGFALLARPGLADEPGLRETIEAAVERYNGVTSYPLPELEEGHWSELLGGGVVRLRWEQPVPKDPTAPEDEQPSRQRVVALYVIDQPRLLVWLSALDPHFLGTDKITEFRLKGDGRGGSTWYQFIDLPWPVRNRHWVIRVTKQTRVAEGTEGQVWEQSWNLVRGGKLIAYELTSSGKIEGVSLDDAREARYLRANTGAWTMFDLGAGRTLLAYQLTIVLGGWIPEGLAAKFAMSTLEELCHNVEKNCEVMPEHYDAEHAPTFDGSGAPISTPVTTASVANRGEKPGSDP